MKEETKVRVLGGENGSNRAEITETTLDLTEEPNKQCLGLIRNAGTLIRPFGSHYVGSACVHYYVTDMGSNPVFHAAPVVTLDEPVTEHLADYGWKELRNALAKAFGRKEISVRK